MSIVARKQQVGRYAWIKPFLLALRETGNITQSAKAAKITRQHVHKRLQVSEAFRKLFDAAMEAAVDGLEKEAWKRAKKGSDRLLMFLLKGRRRRVFGAEAKPEGQESPPKAYVVTEDWSPDEA